MAKGFDGPINQVSHEDYVEWLHEQSLSDNPNTACQARLRKELYPLVERWSKAERERGTDMGDIVFALFAAVMGESLSFLHGAAGDEETRVRAARTLRDQIAASFDGVIDHAQGNVGSNGTERK